MEKDLTLTELFDIYGGLLTEKQRELFSSVYLFDLSLSEIAEPQGTTRQSVYEQVKKVKQKLLNYENVLHIKEKNDKLKALAIENPSVGEKITKIIGE
jgi:predicted DNA-binding protein YlxM (UPF0122 family)